MPERTFDEIYAQVPEDQREQLRQFQRAHTEKRVRVNAMEWRYIDAGQGAHTVLLLVGGLRVADAAYRSIPMLAGDFRVITPTYAAVGTMAELAEGLAGVLEAAGVTQAHVLAGSFGGMAAQVFARKYPGNVARLILSTTSAPDSHAAPRYRQALAMAEGLEPDVLLKFAQQQMFDIIAPPENEGAFYRAYLDELYSQRLGVDDLLSTYRCLIDYHENYAFTPQDLDGQVNDILILDSDDDATFDEAARAAMRRLYPRAKTFVFHGAGHSPGTTQRNLYFGVVQQFLRTGEIPPDAPQ